MSPSEKAEKRRKEREKRSEERERAFAKQQENMSEKEREAWQKDYYTKAANEAQWWVKYHEEEGEEEQQQVAKVEQKLKAACEAKSIDEIDAAVAEAERLGIDHVLASQLVEARKTKKKLTAAPAEKKELKDGE